MEGRSKSLIIRSHHMDGLKYMIVNQSGVIILVIPAALDLTKLELSTSIGLRADETQDLSEVFEIDLEILVEVIEKAGLIHVD